jgi:hypothetical protein
LASLGDAAKVGDQAVRSGRSSVNLLASFATGTPELAKNLAIVLRTLDDPKRAVETDPRASAITGRRAPTGYSGLEALLQYVYDQEQTTNMFDENSYMLKVSLMPGGPCAPYRNAATVVNPNPVTGPPDNLTGPQLIAKCASWLGPHQPGITAPDLTARSMQAAPRTRPHNASTPAGTGTPNPPATSAPTGRGGGSGSPAPGPSPIDLNKTLNQLLGTVPNVPKLPNLPGGVPLPRQVQNASPQSTQALLDYLLGP